MSIDTRSEGDRHHHAHAAWLSVLHLPATTPRGRHRLVAANETRDGLAALIRRAVSALAVWTVAFGLFSIAEGWTRSGLTALLLSGLLVLGVVASCVLGQSAHTESDTPDALGDQRRTQGSTRKEWVQQET